MGRKKKNAVEVEEYEGSRQYYEDALLAIISYYNGKQFDLSKNKLDLFLDLNERLINNRFDSFPDFFKTIMKSYYDQDRTKIMPLVRANAMKNTPDIGYLGIDILPTFINDHISEKKIDFSKVKTLENCEEVLCGLIADRMQDIFGGNVYLGDYASSKGLLKSNSSLKTRLLSVFRERGFDAKGYDRMFAVDNNVTTQIKEEYQPIILSTYLRVVRNCCEPIFRLNTNTTNEKFESYYDSIRRFLMNCEDLMTDRTKARPEFKKAKEKFVEFFGDKIDNIKNVYTIEKIKGEYYLKVREVLKKVSQGTALTNKDKSTLADLLKTTKAISRALKFKDSNGLEYPTQYFLPNVSHNVTPSYMQRLLIDASKVTDKNGRPFFSEEDSKLMQQTASLIHNTVIAKAYISTAKDVHFKDVNVHLNDDEDLESVLLAYRVKTKNADYRSDEAFKKFKKEVEDYMIEFNLPQTKACARSIAGACIHGRKPISKEYLEKGRDK